MPAAVVRSSTIPPGWEGQAWDQAMSKMANSRLGDVLRAFEELAKADPEDPTKRKDSEDDAVDTDVVPVNLLIAKQRNGPTGDVHLVFQRSLTRFESAAKVSDADMPN